MIKNLPWQKTLSMILEGSGECAEVVWEFLGFSIPQWTMFFFIGFGVLAMINIKRAIKSA